MVGEAMPLRSHSCSSSAQELAVASESKTAEFARLFNFFERLTSYKSGFCNDDHTDTDMDDIDSVPLPADLARVVNSLANLLNNRVYTADARHQKKTTGRKRSHTIATTTCNPRDVDSDEESVAKFPLGKKYTFTFRLMLHKLYQMDDWKQKVKEVLERSQNEYKPLSEAIAAAEAKKQAEEEEEKNRKQDGRVHFKAGTPGGSRKPGVRPPANTTLVLGKIKEGKSSNLHLKSPKSPTMVMKSRPPAEEEIRVLKKRCVGRRKSLSGPLSAEGGRIGGNWIYDAAISAAEIAKRGEAPGYQEAGLEGKSHQLGYAALEVVGSGEVFGKRRVSFGAPGTDGRAQKSNSGIATRRRALSVMDNMAPVQTLRKRPLES